MTFPAGDTNYLETLYKGLYSQAGGNFKLGNDFYINDKNTLTLNANVGNYKSNNNMTGNIHDYNRINRDIYSPTFKDEINKFDKNNIYVVYCRTGIRGAAARDIMKGLGFQEVYNISGGIIDWTAQGFPVVK